MADARWANVVAFGTDDQIRLVRQALDEAALGVDLPKPLAELLPRVMTVSFHSPREMVEKGAIIPGSKTERHPDGVAAEGYVYDYNDLWINSSIANNRPRRARHIIRHELWHPIIRGLSSVKKADLRQLMWRENGTHPQRWVASTYQMQPAECLADSLAEACSGIDSPWDDYAYYGLEIREIDFRKVVGIVFRVDPVVITPTEDPDAEVEPAPSPLPMPDPQIEILRRERDEAVLSRDRLLIAAVNFTTQLDPMVAALIAKVTEESPAITGIGVVPSADNNV